MQPAIITHLGACYLVCTELPVFIPQPITSTQGITILPGEKVTNIGSRKRTSFSLCPGLYMAYEGLFYLDTLCYAIFNCPQHNQGQRSLFEQKIYRYAFHVVFDEQTRVACFLVGAGGPKGMRDIILDTVTLFNA
ncbi:hypothetical protein SAMN05421788_110157 [Filimonas lacunae]|uniref:Uncharacterized protein n=1 Tax=Filimonas lacunae TaxID=477680 RepID=A0A173MA66_9BACT|nr:hypothetical protein [Filimonas lacunae]BAV04422.1 hypothetical protein FLA_0413 [Filimonas lacunae]SIT31401.1 hypothetical protein SAMN05421788_110157 [Filimonas lacunae]